MKFAIVLLALIFSTSVSAETEYVLVNKSNDLFAGQHSKNIVNVNKDKRDSKFFWVLELIERGKKRSKLRISKGLKWDQRCYDAHGAGQDFDLTVWVKNEALSLVTSEQQTVSYPDGSKIVLSAGLALKPNGKKKGQFLVVGQRFNIPVNDVKSARSFKSTNPLKKPRKTTQTLANHLTFNGSKLAPNFNSWRTIRLDKKTNKATVYERCIELTGELDTIIDPDDNKGIGGALGNLMGSFLGGQKHFVAKSGTTAYWKDGTIAGKFRNQRSLFNSKPHKGLQCFETGSLNICALKSDLIKKEADDAFKTAFGAGGLGLRGVGKGGGGYGIGTGRPKVGKVESKVRSAKICDPKCKENKAFRITTEKGLQRLNGSFKHCYVSQAKKNPKTKPGKIVYRVKLNQNAKTTLKVQSNSVKNAKVETCVARKLRNFSFEFSTQKAETEISVQFEKAPKKVQRKKKK